MLQLEGKIGIEISIFLKFLFQLSTSRNQKQNFELFRVRIAWVLDYSEHLQSQNVARIRNRKIVRKWSFLLSPAC